MIGSLEQLLHFLFNVKGLIEWGGTLLVCVIVFIETGFFVGFFLPGDSLLVTAGVFRRHGAPSCCRNCCSSFPFAPSPETRSDTGSAGKPDKPFIGAKIPWSFAGGIWSALTSSTKNMAAKL